VKIEDQDPEESQWLELAGSEIKDLRRFSSCPSIQSLRAAGANALPEPQQSMVVLHTAGCRACRSVQADLEALQSPPELEEEDMRRIRSQIALKLKKDRGRRFPLLRIISWRPALAVAAIGICASLFFIKFRDRLPVNLTTDSGKQLQTPPDMAQAFPLEKPDVKLSLAVLTWRGTEQTNGSFANDIAPALDFYRTNRFAEAAAQLEKLSGKYPDSIEVCFYQGISRLFLGAYGSATQSLEKARKLADDSFLPDVDWYLALAYQRSGRLPESRSCLSSLAAGQSRYSERARKTLALLNQASNLK